MWHNCAPTKNKIQHDTTTSVGRPVHARPTWFVIFAESEVWLVTWNVNIPPTPAWRNINNMSKLHGTLTSPPRSINSMSKLHGTLPSPHPSVAKHQQHEQVTWNVNIPPTPAWRSINNMSKLHGTLASPPCTISYISCSCPPPAPPKEAL